MTFIVPRARPDEYGDIGQLTLAGFGHLEPGGELPDGERLALLLDAEGRDRQGVLLVAEGTDGGLLGTASIFPHGVPYARQARAGEAELRLLAVLPSARKQGLGAALLAKGPRLPPAGARNGWCWIPGSKTSVRSASTSVLVSSTGLNGTYTGNRPKFRSPFSPLTCRTLRRVPPGWTVMGSGRAAAAPRQLRGKPAARLITALVILLLT